MSCFPLIERRTSTAFPIIPLSRPSVLAIQIAVSRHYGISLSEMWSERRGWHVSHPRQVAIYLARELTPLSFPRIGREFGNRDHTTAMYACAQVEIRIAEDAAVRRAVAELRHVLSDPLLNSAPLLTNRKFAALSEEQPD